MQIYFIRCLLINSIVKVKFVFQIYQSIRNEYFLNGIFYLLNY